MTLLLLLASAALAESWCAAPLTVHEWGVQVFPAPAEPVVPAPAWFHTRGSRGPSDTPVRHLPPDGGERDLPVLQVYAPSTGGDRVPLAVEVGFSSGSATAWYPQVDVLRTAEEARSDTAKAARARLVAQRLARTTDPLGAPSRPLPPDPTRQLAWESLTLTREPASTPTPASGWVERLRAVDGALWVNQAEESERFVFYEGRTVEEPALVLERGDTWAPDRPHYILRNRSPYPVHDVLVVQGDAVFTAPTIPPGATAGFLHGESHDADPVAWLRERLVDTEHPEPSDEWSWAGEDCVMMRDPAVPVESARGHRLYAAEVDALLSVWGDAFFAGDTPRIVYREDPAALDALVPLAVYTDMYHYPVVRRLGLVLWDVGDLDAASAP